jgi:cytochrome c biogenesis protein CcmG, thiol:disulfide interchange protein DsbE
MRVATLVAATLLLALVSGCAASGDPADGGETPTALGTLQAGGPLPDATLPVLGEDTSVQTSDWRGTPTIINFWATWCAFCVDEMPDLQDAHATLGDQVRFVGVDREDVVGRALKLVAETGVTYDLVEDVDGSFFRAVQARGMPTTVFVDADGTIRYRHAGPLTADEVLDLTAEHLGVTG